MDDTHLLREYVERRSEAAFTELVEQHVDLVYSAALRRVDGDPHRAREVTQMVFTDLPRKASRLTRHPLLAGWLHQSTRWAAASLRRTERRRLRHENAAALEQELGAPDVDLTIIDWGKITPLLDDSLDALADPDREAILLRFFANKPFAEIGGKLGLGENAARMRVERALGKLHAHLAKRGITSTAAALSLALAQNAVASAPAGIGPPVATLALSNAAAAGGSTALAFLLMSKFQLTLAAVIAISLAIGLSLQLTKNQRLSAELAGLHAQITAVQTTQRDTRNQIAVKETALKQVDATIAAQVHPLTPEQQERVRLDTLIRKGELDYQYASLFRRLKLPPGQLDEFKGLLVERNQALYDGDKLAKSHGLEYEPSPDYRALSDIVTGEIDQRIALLLGRDGYARFREYLELRGYLEWAAGLYAQGPTEYERLLIPPDDERDDQLARLLAKSAPDFWDDVYRANGWPVDPPPELRDVLSKVFPAESMQHYDEMISSNATRRRLFEIARDAALQGKLKLSRSSARDYPAPGANPSIAR